MTKFTPANHGVHPAIEDERSRQVSDEGYDSTHDRGHARELLAAATAYEAAAGYLDTHPQLVSMGPPRIWPWAAEHWKPSTPDRMREKAGALALAAIDELGRELDH